MKARMRVNLSGERTPCTVEWHDTGLDEQGRRHFALLWTQDGRSRGQHFHAVPANHFEPVEYVLRFYGSCGHTTDEDIDAESFARWTAPRIAKFIIGDVHQQQLETRNATTIEDGIQVVHVVPDRWCCCAACMSALP